MIKIDAHTSIHVLEKSYSEFQKHGSIDILISKNLESIDFGLIPAIIQFFATWYNQTEEGKIIFNTNKKDEISQFYDLDYVFPSVVYCWRREIVDSEGNDLKPILKEQNAIKHERMRKQTEGGGYKVLLSCFDHLSTHNGLLNSFYIDGNFITNETQFDFAIEKSLRKVISLNNNLRRLNFTPVYDDIIAIIYELMKNTDDWGRTDEFNKPLSPNSRGLFMKLHRRKRESFSSWFKENAGLNNFFSENNFESNTQDELYFLELSVYDAGIGFVRRNEGENSANSSANHQVDIIRKCLVKNNTSATGIQKTIKGQGLDRIMKILDNKGLFWLRTQNVSVVRNLKENRYEDSADGEDIQLFDWFNNSFSAYSTLQSTQGSVVTMVYPLSNLNNA